MCPGGDGRLASGDSGLWGAIRPLLLPPVAAPLTKQHRRPHAGACSKRLWNARLRRGCFRLGDARQLPQTNPHTHNPTPPRRAYNAKGRAAYHKKRGEGLTEQRREEEEANVAKVRPGGGPGRGIACVCMGGRGGGGWGGGGGGLWVWGLV